MVVGFTTTIQSVSIITKVVSSNSAHGEVHSTNHVIIIKTYKSNLVPPTCFLSNLHHVKVCQWFTRKDQQQKQTGKYQNK